MEVLNTPTIPLPAQFTQTFRHTSQLL